MFDVYINNHFLKTPQGNLFQVPTLKLAKAIEDEWENDPAPHYKQKTITSLVATVLDGIAYSRGGYTTYILQSVTQDTVLFWAASPDSIVKEQWERWDPVIKETNQLLNISLKPTKTISHNPLSSEEGNKIQSFLEQLSDFKLVGFSHLMSLSKSFCLSYLIFQGRLQPEAAWDLAHLHEQTQRRTWGNDEMAVSLEKQEFNEFSDAVRFLRLLD